MKEFIIESWIGRGLITFVLSVLLIYIPYMKNRNEELTWHLQLVLFVMSILWGKVGFWFMVIIFIINIDELIKYLKRND